MQNPIIRREKTSNANPGHCGICDYPKAIEQIGAQQATAADPSSCD